MGHHAKGHKGQAGATRRHLGSLKRRVDHVDHRIDGLEARFEPVADHVAAAERELHTSGGVSRGSSGLRAAAEARTPLDLTRRDHAYCDGIEHGALPGLEWVPEGA